MRFYWPLWRSLVSYLLTASYDSFPVIVDIRIFRVYGFLACLQCCPAKSWHLEQKPQGALSFLPFHNILKLINQEIRLCSRLSAPLPSLAHQHLCIFNMHCFRREKKSERKSEVLSILTSFFFAWSQCFHINGWHMYIWTVPGNCEERRVMNPPVGKKKHKNIWWGDQIIGEITRYLHLFSHWISQVRLGFAATTN